MVALPARNCSTSSGSFAPGCITAARTVTTRDLFAGWQSAFHTSVLLPLLSARRRRGLASVQAYEERAGRETYMEGENTIVALWAGKGREGMGSTRGEGEGLPPIQG